MKRFVSLLAALLLLTGCAANQPAATPLPDQTTAAAPSTEGYTGPYIEFPDVSRPTNGATQPTDPQQDQDDQGGNQVQGNDHRHTDANDDGTCDSCSGNLMVKVDFYNINDLHGKIADAANHPGVDEMTTYFKQAAWNNDHVVYLSSGDMWQGASESNTTQGSIVVDWMNSVGFTSMTLGNHEYDWGEDPIRANDAIANFPFLAINIYSRSTDQRVSYCQPSVMIDRGGVQIGIIGAMGDCYSSIAADKTREIYFKTGSQLTALVKAESQRLRAAGADFIVYVLHDGYDNSTGNSVKSISDGQLKSYYDISLSDGYVDLVFEGHTHQRYILMDSKDVYHLQNGGDNQGICHVEAAINSVTGTSRVTLKQLVTASEYANMADDPIVQQLLDKYNDVLANSQRILGTNSRQRDNQELRQLVADLYYQVGMAEWGDEYDIALGGGFISIRDPRYLAKGEVTYAQLHGLFPFDNELVLCSVKGRDLKEKFFESDHYSYFISYGSYGSQLRNNIDPNATYYIVVDSYTSTYAPNNLTEIARYTEGVYARDLLADYIQAGGMK